MRGLRPPAGIPSAGAPAASEVPPLPVGASAATRSRGPNLKRRTRARRLRKITLGHLVLTQRVRTKDGMPGPSSLSQGITVAASRHPLRNEAPCVSVPSPWHVRSPPGSGKQQSSYLCGPSAARQGILRRTAKVARTTAVPRSGQTPGKALFASLGFPGTGRPCVIAISASFWPLSARCPAGWPASSAPVDH